MSNDNDTRLYAENESYFVYLDNLRESGRTNMYDAAKYLAARYELTKAEAREALALWMKTYDKRHPAANDESNES